METIIAPLDGNDTTEDLGPTGLSALRKLRSECRNLRARLHECEAQRSTVRVVGWKLADESGTPLVGLANVQVGELTIHGLRLFHHHGGHVLSWPMRKPRNVGGLIDIMVPTPALDGRILAALLVHAYPEKVAP